MASFLLLYVLEDENGNLMCRITLLYIISYSYNINKVWYTNFCLDSKKTSQTWNVPHILKILDKGWSRPIHKYTADVCWGNASGTCKVYCAGTDLLCSMCPVGMIHIHHLHTYFAQGNPMKNYAKLLPAWFREC